MGVCTTCSHFQFHSCPVGNRFRLKCAYDTEDKKEEANNMKNMNVEKLTSQKPARITHKKWDAITKDYNNGASIMELASKYKMTHSGIAYVLQKQGVRDIQKIGELNREINDIKDKVIADFKTGMTNKEIARKYNITIYMVKKIKASAGLVDSDKSWLENLNPAIIADAKAGMLAKDLREKYNLSAYKTTQIRKKLNIKTKPNRYTNPVKEVKQVEEIKPTIECNAKKGFTFYMKGEGTKPVEKCYPAEKDGLLVWAIDILTVEELVQLGQQAGGSMVIDGDRLDILPMHVTTGTGGDAA